MKALAAATVMLAMATMVDAQSLQQYQFDAAQSQLHAVTHRRGILAGVFGHEHAIVPSSWSGKFCWAPDAPHNGNGSVNIDARSLVIDSDEGRKQAGLGGGPSPGQVRNLQTKLLDDQHLAVERHPEILLDITSVNNVDGDRLDVKGRLTLKGITRDVAFPLRIIPAGTNLQLSGTLTIRQREFGIKPESIAGVVKVADPVDIKFRLVGVPTGGSCQ